MSLQSQKRSQRWEVTRCYGASGTCVHSCVCVSSKLRSLCVSVGKRVVAHAPGWAHLCLHVRLQETVPACLASWSHMDLWVLLWRSEWAPVYMCVHKESQPAPWAHRLWEPGRRWQTGAGF